MTDLIPSPATTSLAAYAPDVRAALDNALSENTRRAYACHWAQFRAWAEDHGQLALPASAPTLAAYLTDMATRGRKASTLGQARAAISQRHREAAVQDPADSEFVRRTMHGLLRTITAAQNGKAPVLRGELPPILGGINRTTISGKRDAALVLVGFAGGFRRSELAALDVSDLRFHDEGLTVTVRRSKTDQEGRGMKKHIPEVGGDLCPVRALRDWLDAASIHSGPVFRKVNRWGTIGARALSGGAVARAVKIGAKMAGLDWRNYSGHSLRSGFVTSALMAGQQAIDVAQQTGHSSLDTLKRYQRDAGYGARKASRAALMGRAE